MAVTLVGLGCGTIQTMTMEAAEAVRNADCLIGAKRLLAQIPEENPAERREAILAEEILGIIQADPRKNYCVLYSGDTGFYSGAAQLIPELERTSIQAQILPGISSVQYFSAKVARPWQDWNLFSAHGRDCDPVAAVMQGKPAFFLTGGKLTPQEICRQLTEAGLGKLWITLGENLSYENERILVGEAMDFAKGNFASLSVMLAEPSETVRPRVRGIPDEYFIRGKVPMTKQEVRAVILSKLAPEEDDIVWDVGAGTGGVSIELALAADKGRVYAVEQKKEGVELIEANKKQFGTYNLTAIRGLAPMALEDLPAPDCVFIGGTMGQMKPILDCILRKNPAARICISSILAETLGEAITGLQERGVVASVTQVSVARSEVVGGGHMMKAQNPIFLITGNCEQEPGLE